MRVAITTGSGASAVTLVLGDDANGAAVVQWRPGRTVMVETEPIFEAETPFLASRSNVTTRFTLVVERTFASLPECLAHIRDHLLALPEQGTIEVSQTTGTGTQNVYLADAVIVEARIVEQIGVSCTWQYEILGGKFSSGATP